MTDSSGLLSPRGVGIRDFPCLMTEYGAKMLGQVYHPKRNPKGLLNLGVAENALCEELLTEKIQSMKMSGYKSEYQYYFDYSGIPSFKAALSRFIEKRFQASSPIKPENLLVTSGVGAAIEHLAFMLCDPGDLCLVHTPYYGTISSDLGSRANVKCLFSHVKTRDENGELVFKPDISQTEATIIAAQNKGQKVRMAIIVNPNNPTGNVLTKEEIMALLQLFNKYKIHVLMDEIYALSMLGDNTITSVLSLENLPCPEMVHFLWGFSKDFGLSGFRCGVIHTLLPNFAEDSIRTLYFGSVTAFTQHLLTGIITDEDWLDENYFPENKKRMDAACDYLINKLVEYGAEIYRPKASYFIWANLNKLLPISSVEEETKLFEEFISAGVYCVPGIAMASMQPGWFRFSFTHPKEYIDLALERLSPILTERRDRIDIQDKCNIKNSDEEPEN